MNAPLKRTSEIAGWQVPRKLRFHSLATAFLNFTHYFVPQLQRLSHNSPSRPIEPKGSWMKVIRLLPIWSTRSLRLPRARPNPRPFPPPPAPISCARTFSHTVLKRTEDIDMAPKGEKFELKTPKGTKDCECAPGERAIIHFVAGSFLIICLR